MICYLCGETQLASAPPAMEPALVERCASGFLSDDPSKFLEALKVLDESWERIGDSQSGRLCFARAIQELAIYRQGSIIKKLMKELLQEQDLSEAIKSACLEALIEKEFARLDTKQVVTSTLSKHRQDMLTQSALIVVLSRFATSKVVAQVFLTDEEFVEKLARNLLVWIARIEAATAFPGEIKCTLRSLATFAHASKMFRQKMQAVDMNLLPAVQKLFSEHNAFLSQEVIYVSLESLARLTETLSLSPDSRGWMINAGYLQVLTELVRSERVVHKEEDNVILRCALSLLRLVESNQCLEKMKESDVFSLLDPYSNLLDKVIPCLWTYVEAKLSDYAWSKEELLTNCVASDPIWKKLRRFALPTVCSWGVCTAPESDSTTAFSKCGRCGVAHYCR